LRAVSLAKGNCHGKGLLIISRAEEEDASLALSPVILTMKMEEVRGAHYVFFHEAPRRRAADLPREQLPAAEEKRGGDGASGDVGEARGPPQSCLPCGEKEVRESQRTKERYQRGAGPTTSLLQREDGKAQRKDAPTMSA
jgi:hypothetical protein